MSPAEREALERFSRALKHLRNMMGRNVSSQILQAYLAVALDEGKPVNEYASILGASATTASRHLMDLADRKRCRREGFKLLYRRDNPLDEREKLITLSQHGKLMRQLVLETLVTPTAVR
jgi:DNA-binding MarR family transcriptional regulator